MAVRKTTAQLLEENRLREQEILRKDEERKAKRRATLTEKESALDERIDKLTTQRDKVKAEIAEIDGVVSTPADEV